MSRSSSKKTAKPESKPPITRLKDAARRGDLVVVIGTGVSMALTNGKISALSWAGLIRDGFAYGVKKGKITSAQAKNWSTQLDSRDIDDLLCAAEFMGRKLDSPHGPLYARWLDHVFKSIQPVNTKMQNALAALHKAGIPICTLNYDPLLERVTGLHGINLSEVGKAVSWMRRENTGILHLHGSWDAPSTCILGIRDYETTLANDIRDLIQRVLGSFRCLLFIGCGDTFADPNFSALIRWLKKNMKSAIPEHYALVRDGDVVARDADDAWLGFVDPVGYGAEHADLPAFLLKHFPMPKAKAAKGQAQAASSKAWASTSEHARLIADYRAFLLKDCGQMTIEGVRADMEIGQRKFDIERLFVPLNVLPCPPEIPGTDPKRTEKILKWEEKNKKPQSFGSVFSKHNCLALLALPGGGKTLLLKRLAVAYADPSRRLASKDNLPDQNVMPVLIRCREWREYIHHPILTILQKLPDISGNARLSGLNDALLPLFKKGRILLLVDGLDEIHNDAHRTIFVENLEAFLAEYKLTRLIVTSREAGFSLLAPTIARFCDRWRVAPLGEDAITALCNHWQRLMAGDSPQAQAEGLELGDHLLNNTSLRRLAENPLLLTMLLVVKHGAGRLPPDRVSLYSRAVEVLLDTWNIKGHDPLNPKEAVPQLAYVAFEMMRVGKQTATEKELLRLLEEARDKVPQIRRYSKDAPHEFLKRVELRSSLLFEAGHQVEAGTTVPFYQFRHLTFQEYLAAVAVAEGHYVEYDKNDTVLTPLEKYLTTEEWKEVIPMAAVLARKQAEPLIAALVTESNRVRAKVESEETLQKSQEMDLLEPRAPSSVVRLVQCLVEEAEAAPETLTAALQLIAFFGSRYSIDDRWEVLAQGPYGNELLHQVWLLYSTVLTPDPSWLMITYGRLAGSRHLWTDDTSELSRLLGSQDLEDIARGIFSCSGHNASYPAVIKSLKDISKYLFASAPTIHMATAFTLAHMWHNNAHLQRTPRMPPPSLRILDRLLELRLHSTHKGVVEWSGIAISAPYELPRNAWRPNLTDVEINEIRRGANEQNKRRYTSHTKLGDLRIAFHAKTVLTEAELAKHLAASDLYMPAHHQPRGIINMLEQMGETGRKYLTPKKSRSNTRRVTIKM